MLFGDNEDVAGCDFITFVSGGGTVAASCGIGVDTTTAKSGLSTAVITSISGQVLAAAKYAGLLGIGVHYLQALEFASGATGSFYGDLNSTYLQTGMVTEFWA